NQTASFLLRLPGELRNRIYTYTLGGWTWTRRSDEAKPKENGQPRGQSGIRLLATCHQIHAEALFLPFALNTFAFADVPVLHMWLRTLSPQRRAVITSIKLRIEQYW
ncbi:hypothetical protein CC86DRAFT_274809, partial [Ophiobolus disseminans]